MVRTVAGKLLDSGRLGLLPAAFNPPTTAHLALADAAQRAVGLDQVVYVLPEALPHKRIERPGTETRLGWLSLLRGNRADRAVATCPTGLVIDIVRAFGAVSGDHCEFFVIAGRDAAERYIAWDYGDGEPFSEQLRRFRLLVASRGGALAVAPELAGWILTFEIGPQHEPASSSRVRRAIRSGGPWLHMVPPEIRDDVRHAYGETRR